MESSDSDDEEDRVSVQHRGQTDRLAREDDYYRFVSDLSEEDYILMRDNNLLGPLGESTEEELQKRLQIMKENLRQNSDENTDRGDASDNESSEDSLLDWLTTSGQIENVTSEQNENQSWREESEISANSDELRFGFESNLECDDENSNPENEYVASAKLPRREDTEDSQRQVENPQSESLFTTASASEHDTTETFMEVPPTETQRRPRSRSPDSRRTRARTDSWTPPRTLWELFQRMNEDVPSQTFKQPLISENDTFSRTGHEETLKQQMPGHELQNRGPTETSRTRNAVPGECYSDTMGSSESGEVRETNPTRPFSPCPVNCPACSQRYRGVSRTQLTSDLPNNATTSEREREELAPMSSDSDEANESAYANTMRNSVHRILNTSLNTSVSGIMSVTTQTILCQTMTVFSDSSNLMDSGSISEHSVSRPSENMGRAESPNERRGPNDSNSGCGSASNASYDSDSSLLPIPVSNPDNIYNATFSQMPGFSASDEDLEISSPMFADSEERSSSTGLSETWQEDGRMTPITDDDSDSGSSLNLEQFLLLHEADPHQLTGLTELQINNLPLRFSEEEDATKICTICITEYTAGTMLRILPCSHEYHYQCIDQWLAEHSTCPICRGPVVDPSEADDSM
ncbi:E3 ubiquitin-protein ligase RLIM-like [Oryx dammah]|uniref:E3 ubiquitin-protein ligase RLIM-like n=1 Tax=Oryx dammah TaxID=59534 RepID=UPI001A9BB89B|nr:E3 ubiquitin-protein ligase RLIM-like [Oryx dammah]